MRGPGENRRTMRVLFVTPRFPGAAARGDQTRALQQLRHLAPRHAITLLTPDPAPAGSPAAHEIARLCERVCVVPASRWRQAWRLASAPATGRPLQCALYDAWPAQHALATLLGALDFDLVHVQMARLAGLFERLSGLPRVLDLVDALSLNMERRGRLDRGPAAAVARREARRLAALEDRLCAAADAVAISAAPDRARLACGREVVVVPNGVDPDEFPYVDARRDGARIVFGANLGYFPNVDAALWFAREVLPRVRRHVPEARLQLVGARPARALQRLARADAAVELVGPVEHMHPWLARAAVAISPLRAGSGLQLKVLEAMASGTPLVASPASAAALEAEAGVHLEVADDAAGMAAAVVRVLRDRRRARALAARAHALATTRYTWAQAAEQLDAAWSAARVSRAAAAAR